MNSSPVRRVLGNKDINTHLTKNTASTVGAKPAIQTGPQDQATMSNLSTSPTAGVKRKIEEVEDAERVDGILLEDSQRTQLLSDSETEDVQLVDASPSNVERSYNTADTSFSTSQNPFESHFELHQEEMSQRTLDKLNEVPMPQNNSQLPPLRPALLKEMSAGSVGLSCFVNLEDQPSSQLSDVVKIPEDGQLECQEVTTVHEHREENAETIARRKLLSEKAAELQTRLQLAFYKVQTKQTNQPFSRLKRPQPTRGSSPPTDWLPNLNTPRLSSSTIREPSSVRTVVQPPTSQGDTASAEDGIAAIRAQALGQPKPFVRNLASLPIPQLDPELTASGSQHYPSSPPLSRQTSSTSEDQLLPQSQGSTGMPNETQLSSSPASREASVEYELTRSVSKGEAASGLVALMHSGSGI